MATLKVSVAVVKFWLAKVNDPRATDLLPNVSAVKVA